VQASLSDFAQAKFGKSFDSLSDVQKEICKELYAKYAGNSKDVKPLKEWQLSLAVDVMNFYNNRL
jgi:hypothetical protein